MRFSIEPDHRSVHLTVRDLVLAGWTGRDRAATEEHIRELGAVGVAPPKSTPVFYRVAASLLTTASGIEVVGRDSTGEIEFVLLNAGESLLVGVGSDHTDRKVEAIGITVSKQLCAKVLAPGLWNFADVEPHWDDLILRAHCVVSGERSLYQEGSVSRMMHPGGLITNYGSFAPGTVMFSGTLPVTGGLRWADTFEIELEDPVLSRRIAHSYDIRPLPVEG
jgi:hypothetical protein